VKTRTRRRITVLDKKGKTDEKRKKEERQKNEKGLNEKVKPYQRQQGQQSKKKKTKDKRVEKERLKGGLCQTYCFRRDFDRSTAEIKTMV
jgi:hypothetical protein